MLKIKEMNKTKLIKIIFVIGVWILLSTFIINIYNENFEIVNYNNNSQSLKKIFQLNGDLKDEKLSIFLIPHSHCDSGWLQDYDVCIEFFLVLIISHFFIFFSNNYFKYSGIIIMLFNIFYQVL